MLAHDVPTAVANGSEDVDFDLFDAADVASDATEAETHRDKIAAQRLAKLAELPTLEHRTSAQARTAYTLSQMPLQPTRLPKTMTVEECELVLQSLVHFVMEEGTLRTDRHERFPTTDVPVQELSMPCGTEAGSTVGLFVSGLVRERILPAMAEATGCFLPDHFDLKDLFVVCYSGAVSEDVSVVPSNQSALALHRDGCLLSFSLLLNHADAFTGGGTFFKSTGTTVLLEQGECLIHDARLEHAGAEVLTGQRIVLVGFVETVEVLEEKRRWADGRASRRMPGQIGQN